MFYFFMCDCVCVLLEIVQFKSIQMIDSDNWPWLVCLTDPCCAEGDMITLFPLAMRNASIATFRLAGWLAGWMVDRLVGWFEWLAGFCLADTKSCGSKNRKMP